VHIDLRVEQKRHRSFEKEIHTVVQHNSDARDAQRPPTSNRSQRSLGRLSKTGARLAILCLGVIALGVALILSVAIVVAWPQVIAHLSPVFGIVPKPWGCTGSPVPC
jgi:hypothetical protein